MPSRASRAAAVEPAGPPPMTRTWVDSLIMSLLLRGDGLGPDSDPPRRRAVDQRGAGGGAVDGAAVAAGERGQRGGLVLCGVGRQGPLRAVHVPVGLHDRGGGGAPPLLLTPPGGDHAV